MTTRQWTFAPLPDSGVQRQRCTHRDRAAASFPGGIIPSPTAWN